MVAEQVGVQQALVGGPELAAVARPAPDDDAAVPSGGHIFKTTD